MHKKKICILIFMYHASIALIRVCANFIGEEEDPRGALGASSIKVV